MDCKYFDGCSAPLCPRDEGVADRTWFPDEDICRLADVPEWVKRQRKVSRKAAQGGYFTLAMLRHDCRIPKGIKGIDPDGTDEERAAGEAAWFKAHPVITEAEREKKRSVAVKNLASALGVGTEKTTPHWGLNVVSGEKGSLIPPAMEKAGKPPSIPCLAQSAKLPESSTRLSHPALGLYPKAVITLRIVTAEHGEEI